MARSLPDGACRDQPKPPRARGVCSPFNGKYCHCQAELGNGQREVFFISVVRAGGGPGWEPGVPVLRETAKPPASQVGLSLLLVRQELEGELAPPANAVPASALRLYFRVRARSLTSPHASENDGTCSS